MVAQRAVSCMAGCLARAAIEVMSAAIWGLAHASLCAGQRDELACLTLNIAPGSVGLCRVSCASCHC